MVRLYHVTKDRPRNGSTERGELPLRRRLSIPRTTDLVPPKKVGCSDNKSKEKYCREQGYSVWTDLLVAYTIRGLRCVNIRVIFVVSSLVARLLLHRCVETVRLFRLCKIS